MRDSRSISSRPVRSAPDWRRTWLSATYSEGVLLGRRFGDQQAHAACAASRASSSALLRAIAARRSAMMRGSNSRRPVNCASARAAARRCAPARSPSTTRIVRPATSTSALAHRPRATKPTAHNTTHAISRLPSSQRRNHAVRHHQSTAASDGCQQEGEQHGACRRACRRRCRTATAATRLTPAWTEGWFALTKLVMIYYPNGSCLGLKTKADGVILGVSLELIHFIFVMLTIH